MLAQIRGCGKIERALPEILQVRIWLETAPVDEVLARLAASLDVPVIAEGRIATPEQAAQALRLGAWAVVVGSAITRPRWITERFAAAVRGAVRNTKTRSD